MLGFLQRSRTPGHPQIIVLLKFLSDRFEVLGLIRDNSKTPPERVSAAAAGPLEARLSAQTVSAGGSNLCVFCLRPEP